MNRLVKCETNGPFCKVKKEIICDSCMRIIYDSSYIQPQSLYYLATISQIENDDEITYDLCGTECARKLFDTFLERSKKTIQPGRFDIRAVETFSRVDPKEVSNDMNEEGCKRS